MYPARRLGYISRLENLTMSTPDQEPAPKPESAELMYIKCAYCGAWMDVKPGHLNAISHGLCESCYAAEMRKLDPPPSGTD